MIIKKLILFLYTYKDNNSKIFYFENDSLKSEQILSLVQT